MKFLITILLSFISFSTSAQVITTYAGNGTYGNSGNGGPATLAQFAWLYGLATDNTGNLYICDIDNNMVRKVDAITGIVTAFAGTGVLGYTGDGGTATTARLYHPSSVAIDNLNNVYVVDQNGGVIRKINTSGIITSITPSVWTGGYSGDGGPLILAQFNSISGISFDNTGVMYIADNGNHVIRKVSTTDIVSTFAGNGTMGYSGDGGPATAAQLFSPYEVVVKADGTVLIPDPANHRIRSVSTAGIINTYAGTGATGYSGDGGPAILAELGWPWHSAMDPAGNVYIADGFSEVVRKIDNNGIITTFAGNGTSGYTGDGGPATSAQMIDVCGVASDNGGNIFIVNRTFPNVVRKVTNCLTATISGNPANVALCNAGNAVFSVTAANADSYQWQEKIAATWNNLSDNTTYSGSITNTLTVTGANISMNNYQYRCVVTNTCASVNSLPATLFVTTPTTPTINISIPGTTICAGNNAVFIASISNGGISPVYQWKKNGLPVGTNLNTYSDNGLLNGDVISCSLTSNSTCATTNNANSNSITMSVSPVLTPSITISASQNGFCFGTLVSFSSSGVNAGTTPAYQWKKNGINVGTNSGIYTDNALQNGDVISCILTSSYNCLTANNVSSNAVVMNVTPLITPAVTISAIKTSLCKGETAFFNAVPVNGGPLPAFQWKKNGLPVGGNNNSYTDNNIVNNDIISCTITSNGTCLTSSTANSNNIVITLNPDPVVSLNKSTSICFGSSKILDAGNFNSYLWNDGSTNRTLAISLPGTYSVKVTDNNNCIGKDTSILTSLLPLPQNFLPGDSSICAYDKLLIKADAGYLNYLWNTGAFSPNLSVTAPGSYWLQVTDINGCEGKDTIKILKKDCLKGLYIPNAFTPDGNTRNDIFKPFIYGTLKQFEFTILNRYGEIVFYTKDVNKGWDGRYKGAIQNAGVFTWICIYQIDQQMINTEKGTVLLLR